MDNKDKQVLTKIVVVLLKCINGYANCGQIYSCFFHSDFIQYIYGFVTHTLETQ